jgi:type I restriction enzyme S subunit
VTCVDNVVLRPKETFNKYFLNYQFNSIRYSEFTELISRGVTLTRISRGMLGNNSIVVPPLLEQNQIVQFLDEKTELIDKLISTKERKITLLKEQRTSLINQVVTKGLNPNVKMKDSRVEWIGEIPEHWSIGKLNYLCERIGDGLHSTPIYFDNTEFYFINGNNIKEDKIVIFENTKTVEYEEYVNHYIELNEKNTLLLSINGTIGSLGYYKNEKVILGKSVCYINIISDSINLDYLFFLLGSSSIQNYFTFQLTGTTIYNLSLNSIRKTPICLPNKIEQIQIVDFLDSKTKEIDDLVSLEQKKIDLLKEYRQSLISEVVTGKIKVTTD